MKELNKLPKDKLLHCLIGIIVFIVLNFTFYTLENSRLYALIGSLVVGISIEVYQKITKTGVYEGRDILATFLGGIFGYLSGV